MLFALSQQHSLCVWPSLNPTCSAQKL